MGKHRCCCKAGPRGPAGNASDVIWWPFYSGSFQSNIVSNPGASGWERVTQLLSRASGPRTLYLNPQDSLGQATSPFIIPSGTYDMTDVTVSTSLQWNPLIVQGEPAFFLTIQEGARLTNFLTLEGPFGVDYQGTSGPAVVIDVSNVRSGIYITLGSGVICSGTQPLWQFTDPSDSDLKGTIFLESGIIGFQNNYVIHSVDAEVDIFMIDNAIISNATLSSTVDGEYQILLNDFFAANGLQLGFQIPFIQATHQPDVLGSVSIVDTSIRSKTVDESGAPTALDSTTRGFKVGDTWIDGTDVYVRTGTGATGWVLVS